MELLISLIVISIVIIFGSYWIYPLFHKESEGAERELINYPTVIAREEPVELRDRGRENEIPPVTTTQTEYRLLWIEETLEYLDHQKSLSDLLIVKEIREIYYGDLLQCFEWKSKRLNILLRDRFECQKCKKKDIGNHVHHTYYLQHELPWDINDQALETLCYYCHKNVHEESTIPVYKIENHIFIEVARENPKCSRCGGTGYLPHFSHVQNGICFKCGGNTLSKSVFNTVLQNTYRNLNSYNENMFREKYRREINKLSEDEFFNKIPNARDYIYEYNKRIEEEDDLPF